MAFFLLSGPDLGSGPGIGGPQATAAREEQAHFEHMCGISRGPGRCTLLLYSQPGCSNFASDQWS